jgi:hypothetical protein
MSSLAGILNWCGWKRWYRRLEDRSHRKQFYFLGGKKQTNMFRFFSPLFRYMMFAISSINKNISSN